ncbi:putative divalent cation/proton antiporter TMEM165 [Tribolium castaneum]|uniref:GDT1 family protein n=1 Tax=Tribolium castaneum TaxID=7070 RepID=D2A1N6_TRICA|nr:PREDICTED: transmembrane protein 165 [Tribolium castaneum]EFA02700.1 Transmembrane protein 165-like Protein [Tribolium castaneum]|eukprot:XP_971334.1 PREDICTED: transmembrane protein 165 [Tribolium castaneum]
MKGKLISSINRIWVAPLLYLIYLRTIYAELEPKEESPEVNGLPSAASSDDGPGKIIAVENFGFIHAFVASFSVILVSEIGDKTFFIAAIMAMRHPRTTVFAGAISALALMTVLSALFGWLANVIPRAYTFYISTALFAIFGLKMLKEGCAMSPGEGQEELEEVQSDLRKKEEEYEKQAMLPDPESGAPRKPKSDSIFSLISRIFLQSFTLTFLAEWGDRSQLTTIILGAREDVYGVIIGGIAGHSICTGLAVLGGRMIAQRISVRTVTIIGGVVFLLFAFSALFFDPNMGG